MIHVVDLRLLPAAVAAWVTGYVMVAQSVLWSVWVGCGVTFVLLTFVVFAAVRHRGNRNGSPIAQRDTVVGQRQLPGMKTFSACAAAVQGQIVFVLLVVVAVTFVTAMHLHTASSAVLENSALARGDVEVVARVTADPRVVSSWGGNRSFLITVTTQSVRSTARNEAQQVQAHLVLFGDESWAQVRYGSTVRTHGRVERSPDAGAKQRFRLAKPGPPTLVQAPNAALAPFGQARQGLVLAAQNLPAAARGLVPGIGVGDRSHLSPELGQAMRVTGLTHITAVSGSHFAIVVAAVLAVLSLLRFPRWARVLASAMAMGAFVLLVRPEPSVARAALMGGFALMGLSIGRPARALTALAAGVIGLLLADPWLARSYGFILSVLATAGIVLWAGPLARFLGQWLPQWLALVVAVPIVAQAVCGPVVILLEPNFATYAVLANILATPALAPATLCGVLAAVVSTVWPAGAQLLATCAGWAASWIAGVAVFFADLPGAYPPWPAGGRGAMLLAALSVIVVLSTLAIPYLRHCVLSVVQKRRRPWLRAGSSFSGQTWDS